MSKLRIFLLLSLFLYIGIECKVQGQLIYYQDIFKGGVTGAGVSFCLGSGTDTIPVYIEPGSTIRQAYLFTYRIGNLTPSYTVSFNNSPITFSEYNRISLIFANGGIPTDTNFSVHAEDVTNLVSPTSNNYSISFPVPPPPFPINCINCHYQSAYLVVFYQNDSLGILSSSILLDTMVNNQLMTFSAQDLNPMIDTFPIGFSIYSDRLTLPDSVEVRVNGFNLGIIGDEDNVNTPNGCGVKGHFYYQDTLLFGLDDDTPDNVMGGSDGLADIQTYVPNNSTSLAYSVQTMNASPLAPYSNFFPTFQLAHITSCDTFTASVAFDDTLVCLGDSAQLFAFAGIGAKYNWKPSIGLSCDTCPDPYASPDSSILYTVQIWDSDSCSRVFPIKVNIHSPISFTPVITPATCGGLSDGSIAITNVQNSIGPIILYYINGSPQPFNIFSSLDTGIYQFEVLDSSGCRSMPITVTLNDTNYVTASFIANPTIGYPPLDVNFTYTGNNGVVFTWSFGTGDSAFIANPAYTFNNTGAAPITFPVTLITWANDTSCADTAIQFITVNPDLVIYQLISPNNDGRNDTWILQDLAIYPNAAVDVYNRWGNKVYSAEPYQNNWGGTCDDTFCINKGGYLPAGTYYYVVYPFGKNNTNAQDVRSGYLELQP